MHYTLYSINIGAKEHMAYRKKQQVIKELDKASDNLMETRINLMTAQARDDKTNPKHTKALEDAEVEIGRVAALVLEIKEGVSVAADQELTEQKKKKDK